MKKIWNRIRNRFKSYRRKFKIYFAITFFVPVIVILIVNIFTTKMLKEQAVEAGENTMSQFFAVMEERMATFEEDAYSIVRNASCLEYARLISSDSSKWHHRKYFLLQDEFDDLKLRGYAPCYTDILVWFAGDNYVVSGYRGDLPVEEFCRMNYSQEENFVKKFVENVTNAPITPKYWTLEDSTGKRYLFMSLKQTQSQRPALNFNVTIELDTVELMKMLGDGVISEQNENMILFDKTGEMLFMYKPEGVSYLPEKCRESGVYEIEHEDQQYTLFVQQSKAMKGYYVMQLPHDSFYENQIKVTTISMMSILISIAAGLLAMHMFSKSAYRPIENMLSEVQNKMNRKFDAYAYNEYEFIMESIQSVNRGEGEKTSWAKEIELARQKELIMAVLDGQELLAEEICFLEEKNVFVKDQKYYVAIIQLQSCGEVGWDLLAFVVSNVFEELFEEVGKGYVVSFSAAHHVVVLRTGRETEEETLVQLLKYGQAYLQEHFKMDLLVSTGSYMEGHFGLRSMYREAQIAYEYLFLLEEKFVTYEEVAQRQYVIRLSVDGNIYNRVKDYLQSDKSGSEEVFVSELFLAYGIERNAALDMVEVFRIEVLNALGRIFIKSEISHIQRRFYMELLLDARTLEQYRNHLIYILKELNGVVEKNDGKKLLGLKIKDYVDANFREQNMSVAMVGEALGMQAQYLSKVFKEEYHVSLLDYIIEMRITFAKKLLADSRLTVNEVAEECGYLSGSVFIKTFKKVTGVTPGNYRANMDSNYEHGC